MILSTSETLALVAMLPGLIALFAFARHIDPLTGHWRRTRVMPDDAR